MNFVRAFGLGYLLLTLTPLAGFQDMQNESPRMHEAQQSKKPSPGVIGRGNAAMGFDQTKTTHHFLLKKHGGIIQVTANDPADAANREMIQGHLTHIATAFSKGDFDIPMLVHDQVPAGVPEMRRLKDKIHYRYEPLEAGGRVVIETNDPKALAAVHKFLRFQIQDHGTGDSLKVN